MQTKNIHDRTVALVVVGCSVLLLAALAWALSGAGAIAPSRTIRLYAPDFTGINPGSVVRYGGVRAGVVHRMRILSVEERKLLPDPACLVEVTLALQGSLPPLPSDIYATVAAETLLADKFVSLLGGSPAAAPLANDAVIPAIAPVTIDALVFRLDGLIRAVNGAWPSESAPLDEFLSALPRLVQQLETSLTSLDEVITQTRGVVGNGGLLVGEGRELIGAARVLSQEGSALITETRAGVGPLLQDLQKTARDLSQAARQAEQSIAHLDPKLRQNLQSLQRSLDEFQVAAVYGRLFTETIARQPHRVIWGQRNPPTLPSPEEILRRSSPPAQTVP